jgi:cytochrome c oxidase cbb3-type subunit III
MKLLLTTLLDPATNTSTWHITSGQDLVWLLILCLIGTGVVLILLTTLYLAYILRQALEPKRADKPADTRSFWQRMAGLHALSDEKSLVMEHAYDGIVELDNPTPPWFMGLFYGTIGFGVVYLLIFHVAGTGDIMRQEYTQEVALAEQQRETYLKQVAGKINENTVTRLTDAKGIESGKALYGQYCTACHGQNAEGKVGPNLTDEYWLHGGSVKAIYHTIAEGVPEKGMLPWKKQLNPLQIQQVSSYLLSLQGSKPAGAKEPQGEKEAPNVPTTQAEKVAAR